MRKLPPSILVTGAASGIGFAAARYFLEQGLRVIAADRDAHGLSQLVSIAHGELASFVCDLTDAGQLEQFFHEAAAIGYSGAVNCAGTEGRPDSLMLQSRGEADAVLDLNARATLHCLREELRHMAPQHRGTIVNMTSIYGLRGQPRWAVYSASKAAVIGMTQGAALEMAQSGLRVNAVAPGPIETPLLARTTQGDFARTAAMVPMKRNGSVAEVVQAITWLLSDESSYVTGCVLPVDGGMSAQAATVPDMSSINT